MTCQNVTIHPWKIERQPDGTDCQTLCEPHEAEGWCVYERHDSGDPRQGWEIQNETDWTGPDAESRSFAFATSLAERLGVHLEED